VKVFAPLFFVAVGSGIRDGRNPDPGIEWGLTLWILNTGIDVNKLVCCTQESQILISGQIFMENWIFIYRCR
jgi:hypothetical protein